MGASACTSLCCHACLVTWNLTGPVPAMGAENRWPNRQRRPFFHHPYSKSRGGYIRNGFVHHLWFHEAVRRRAATGRCPRQWFPALALVFRSWRWRVKPWLNCHIGSKTVSLGPGRGVKEASFQRFQFHYLFVFTVFVEDDRWPNEKESMIVSIVIPIFAISKNKTLRHTKTYIITT